MDSSYSQQFSTDYSKWFRLELMILLLCKIDCTIFTTVGFSLISMLSLPLFISNHQKVPLLCLTQVQTDIHLIPVCSLPTG